MTAPQEHADDKTERSLTDELRRAAKLAAPYAVTMIGASHLNKAADTIDTLRARLVEAEREAVSLARYLFYAYYSHEPHYASGEIEWEPCDTPAGVITQIDDMVAGICAQLAEAQHELFAKEAERAAIDAAKGEQ